MDIPVDVPGYEGRGLTVKTGGLVSTPRVWIDGQPAPKAKRRGDFVVRRSDGVEDTITLRNPYFVDPIPQLVHQGVTYQLAPPFRWYQWVIIVLPLCLVAIGGCIGGALGGGAAGANAMILRANIPEPARTLLAIMVTTTALIALIALAVVITLARSVH